LAKCPFTKSAEPPINLANEKSVKMTDKEAKKQNVGGELICYVS
jgi:hypothetical protein